MYDAGLALVSTGCMGEGFECMEQIDYLVYLVAKAHKNGIVNFKSHRSS